LKPPGPLEKELGKIFRKIRWVLKDTVGVELPPPARKPIDLREQVLPARATELLLLQDRFFSCDSILERQDGAIVAKMSNLDSGRCNFEVA